MNRFTSAAVKPLCLHAFGVMVGTPAPFSSLMRHAKQVSRQHPQAFSSTAQPLKVPKMAAKRSHAFIPRKAPLLLTETARKFFKALLKGKEDDKNVIGIMLNYHQSSTGEPRMVFAFDFVRADQLEKNDESVSLEILEDGTAKPPAESCDDGLPKLYVHHNAFMKVLGGKLDVDTDTFKLTLYDREGNEMDPNNA